jgi:YidC/Oxa1 family membrane protein insertase
MNFGQPDPYYVLPVLVFVTMFFQTRFSSPAKPKKSEENGKKGKQEKKQDDPTAAMTQSMQYTMPIMFGFFSLSFQAGLSIYFVLSNLIGMGQGYYTRKIMEQEKAEREKNNGVKEVGLVAEPAANGEVVEGKKSSANSTTAVKNPPSSKSSSNNSSSSNSKKKRNKKKR